jgi:hypothetical protein
MMTESPVGVLASDDGSGCGGGGCGGGGGGSGAAVDMAVLPGSRSVDIILYSASWLPVVTIVDVGTGGAW